MEEMRDKKKKIRRTYRKQYGRSKYFPIRNYFKCKWIKLSKNRRLIEWIIKPVSIQLYTAYKSLTLDLRTCMG